MHTCSFSSNAAELKKSERTQELVLKALSESPRISTWDMGELSWLRSLVADLEQRKFIEEVPEPYPWHKWKLTDEGRKKLSA